MKNKLSVYVARVQERIRWTRRDPVKPKVEKNRSNDGEDCLANRASPVK